MSPEKQHSALAMWGMFPHSDKCIVSTAESNFTDTILTQPLRDHPRNSQIKGIVSQDLMRKKRPADGYIG
jgi:hypothetical protein